MKKTTFTKKAMAFLLALAMIISGITVPQSNVKIVNAQDNVETSEVVPMAEETEGIVGTTEDPTNAEARIGDAYFTTFAEAVSAARNASSNVTVTLLKDVTVSSGTQIASTSKKTITYDGDGKQRTITTSVKNAMIVGNTGAKVVFQNIKLNHTTEQGTLYMSKSATLELKNVDIDVKNITNYQYGLISLFGTTDTDADNTKEEMTLNMEDVTITMDNVGVKNTNSENNALIRTGNGGDTNDKIVHFNMKNCTLDASTSSGVHAILTPGTTDCYAVMEDCTFSTYDAIPLQFNGSVKSMDKTRCNVSIETTDNLKHYNASNKKVFFTDTYTAEGAVPVAQVGKTLYADLASAVSAATEGQIVDVLSDVTLGTEANSTSSTDATARTGQITIGKGITIDGNQHKITTYVKHTFKVNYAGAVALKNMEVDCYQQQSFIQVSKAAQVTLSDIDINVDSKTTSYYQYGIIAVPATGTGIELNLARVDVTMVTGAYSTNNHAVIRTGNDGDAAKTISIKIDDCDWNLSGADDRIGIMIMKTTTATIDLKNSTIHTMNAVPIYDNSTAGATITKSEVVLKSDSKAAQIGKTAYNTVADAVTAANSSTSDVTIQLLNDSTVSSQLNLMNDNSVVTTFEGNGYTLTTSGTSGNAIVIYGTLDGEGTYEFKNMNIVHGRPGVLVQLNTKDVESTNEETGEITTTTYTSKKAIVKFTNVDITNTNNGGYLYGLVTTLPTGSDANMRVDFDNVDVTLSFDSDELGTNGGAIIRTGNNNEKTVTINIKDSNIDLKNAANIRGISITEKSKAAITMTNSSIVTKNIAAIEANRAAGDRSIVFEGECSLDSLDEEIDKAPIVGFEAQVGNKVYRYFSTALSEAEAGATVKLLQDVTTGWRNITKSVVIDGNGYTISSNEGTETDKHTFVIKEEASEVTFKNMNVVQKRRGVLFRTDIATTLTLENVHIDATQAPVSTEYALFQLMGKDVTTNLICNEVTVDMDATEAGLDSYPAIIRTGNAEDKEVNITLTNCNLDATGAAGRHGIVIINKTVANVELIGTTITTMDAAPIMDYSRTAEVTRDENSTISCIGNYEAYVDHDVYATFAEALKAANAASGNVTLGLLKDVSVAKDISIGNTKGKIYVEGNGYTITTEGGENNNAFKVDKKAEVEFRNMTIVHKNYGSAIQVTKAGTVLTLTNVFVDAKYAAENSAGTYNYTLINMTVSSTLNMKNVDMIMEVENPGAASGKQASLIRTGNKDNADKTYKDIEINLVDCILDATKATDRSGILVVDADVQLNLKGNTQILTQSSEYAAAIRGLEGTKKAIISMEDSCLLRSGESSEYEVVVKNLDTSGIADTCTWTYKKYDNLTAFRTTDDLMAPTTVPTGYVFAGWYTDKTCTAEYALEATDITTTSAYAKFVPDHVIDVKAQLSENLLDGVEDKEKGAIRFVTTVDSMDYKRVGFEFKIVKSGKVIQLGTNQSKNVYRELYAVASRDGEAISYTPEIEFCAESQYFKTVTIKGIPQNMFDAEITVKPFWVTLDGTKVYGDEVTKTINQGLEAADKDGNVADSDEIETVYTNRVVLVSDLHYTTSQEKAVYDAENWSFQGYLTRKLPNASYAAGDAFGYTQEQKLEAAIADINALGAKEKIDSVMVLGDLTLDDYGYRNLVKNYLADFKTNFMDKLNYPAYAIAGNHDSYTNTEWKNVIGTDRQYSVLIGDAVFVMLDTFEDEHATSGSGSSYKGVDIEFLTAELQKEEYVGKTIFLCAHNYTEGKLPENDAALKSLIASDSRIAGMFDAHTHVNNVKTPDSLAGAPLVNIGGYAYGSGIKVGDDTEFGVFDKSWAWGYQVIEWNESEVHIYHVKSARTYTDYLGNVHNYKGAIEGDMVIKLNK